MRRRLDARGLALLVGAALLASVAAPAPAGAAALKERLPNGVTVLVRENVAAPVVAVSLLVRAGERWESADDAGVTNFLHQVMVKGTASRSALELAEAAERIGGSVSASGDTDFSEIRGTALARHWGRLLELIADVGLRPSLADAEIEKERGAILTAIRTRADQPFQRAFDTLKARLFGAHPYAMPSLGRAAVVERLGRQDLLDHYRRYYRGGRVIVSVSGHVGSREVLAAAGRLFGELPAGEGEPDAPPPPARSSADRVTVTHPAAQAQVLAGVLGPAIGHPDYAAVKVLSTVLGGGMAGRLFAELRNKRGLAYSTGALYPSRVEQSFLAAYMGTAPANAERAEDGMRRELERIRAEGVREEELGRAKAYLLGQFALDRRTNARLAWYQAFFEAASMGHDFDERYVRAVEGITVADLGRVAKAYLGAPTVVNLGPPAK